MLQNLWWLLALLLAVLCFDNFLLALNWFHHDHSDTHEDESINRHDRNGPDSLYEKAKESLRESGRRTASSMSKKYEENVAKPLKHLAAHDEEFWPWLWRPSAFDGSRPWTHSVASTGQFRTFPNEYIVYLDMPGVPKEEVDVFAQGRRLRVHGTCLFGSGEIDRFCLERQVDCSFNIPEDVMIDHMDALLKDGVLMLKLPRLQDDDENGDDLDDGRDNESVAFGGKRTKLRGKRILVKDYKPTWKERVREAGEAVCDRIKGAGNK